MEPEKQPSETSDNANPPSATTEHQQQTTVPSTPRSYECNFCKRGFTNAQALGGHMNIHRKDKTKLKHSSSSSTTTTTPPHIATVESPSPTRPRLTTADPFSVSHQGKLLSVPQPEGQKQLPLFDNIHGTAVQRNIHHPQSPERDVDLELRLGHVEPPTESSSENKTTSTTTRKFFD